MAKQGLNTGIYLRITQVMFFLPLLSLGTLYRSNLEKYINSIGSGIYFFGVFFVQAFLQITGVKFEAVSSWMTGFTLHPLYIYMYAINGIALLLRISRILVPVIGDKPAVMYLGRNTKTVMLHHIPVYFLIHLLIFSLMPYVSMFADFDVTKFTTNVYYHYYPNGKNGLSFIYVILTLVIPLYLLRLGQIVSNKYSGKIKCSILMKRE